MINLKNYPSDWSITPLNGKKPLRDNWNYEEPLSRDTLIQKYPNHNIGLRTGNVSNGILAIDFDGNDGCKKLWDEIKGSNEDLPTVSFKSGKAEGYHQRLYKIPDKYRDILNEFTRKELKAKVVNPDTGKEEQLEFRYNTCQSVLPPSIHPDTNKPYKWLYSPEKHKVEEAPIWLLDFIINKWNYQKNQKVNINDCTENKGLEISLFKCLSKNTRALIDKGVNEGNRNNTGFKIACEIIGTAKYIESKGLSYQEEQSEIFTQYCEKCTPPLDSNEYEKIWESANGDEREPVLSEDHINACINAQLPKKNNSFNKTSIPINEVIKQVEALVDQNLKKSELESRLNDIAKKSGISSYNLKLQYNALLEESDYDLEKVDLKERIDKLISLEKSSNSVYLGRFLPKELEYNLNFLRPILGSTNLALLSVLMTCIGNRIHPYLYLNLIKASGFKARGNNLFTAIVGESGEAKSPTISLFTDPLNKIQAEYNQDYDKALKEYEIKENAFNNLSKEEKQAAIESGLKPEKPKPKDCIINDSTIEQLLVILNNQPTEGVLLHYDELSGLINGMNRYKKNGNDRETILGFRDGKAPNVHRKNGTRLTTTKASVGIVGAITTDILMQQMEDGNDPSGHWARFIYAFIPRTKQEFPEDTQLNFDNYLYLLYKRVYDITGNLIGEGGDNINDLGLDLSYGAKNLYRGYFEHIEEDRFKEDSQAIRSYLSKSKRLVGELAFILHVLYGVYEVKAGNTFPMEVDINTLEKAIELTNILTNQVRLIHSKLNNKEVSALHKAILDYARNKPKVVARDVKRQIWLFKDTSSDDIRAMFLELERLNYGTTQGKGARLSFSLNKPNGDNPNGGTNKPTPDTPPADNNSKDIVITNNYSDTTSDFNIGTGNNYSTVNLESNGNSSKNNNFSIENLDTLEENTLKHSQGKDFDHLTLPRQLSTYTKVKNSKTHTEQYLQKSSTLCQQSSTVLDSSPTVEKNESNNEQLCLSLLSAEANESHSEYNVLSVNEEGENDTVVIENGEIIIDESKLDLFKKYDTPIPEWQPTKEIKPFESLTQCHLDIETLGLDANEARVITIGLTLTKNNKTSPDTPPADNNSTEVLVTNTYYNNTTEFNIGTGNNYSTNNLESNTQFKEKNNFYIESVDSLDKNESKPSQGNDLSLLTVGRQLTFDFPSEIFESHTGQWLQKMSTVFPSWSSVADISPTVSENKTVVIENGEIIIDESKLDLFKKYDTPIPEWQPTKEIKPFESLSQCVLDIETDGLDPYKGRVFMIGLSLTKNNKTEYTIITNENEAQMLRELNKYLLSNTIDLLIGHNIFNFDIPFLIKRAEINKVPTLFKQAGEKYINNVTSASFYGKPMKVRQCVLKGVDIIDTMVLAAIYDKSKAVLNNYRLKDVAIAIGYRDERRLELTGNEINDYWEKGELEPIDKYLRYDLDDTKAISDFLLPPYHYQTKVVNMSLQKLVLSSPAKIWNTISESFYSENYIDSISADDKLNYQGAKVFANPCFVKNAFKIDVSSMYPSIILTYRLNGKKDIYGKLLSVMKYLTNERLRLKKLHFETKDEKYNHQQNAMKILINGGYGFFGTGGYKFNDYTVAAKVTAYGRALMGLMLDKLNELNINVHEVDTDGIICSGYDDAKYICQQVQSALPAGIDIGVDWENTDIYIYKAKNYILFNPNGKIKRVGIFRKRNRYKLQNDFTVDYLNLYREDAKSADEYYQSIIKQLEAGTYDVEDLKITQTIPKSDKRLTGAGIGKHGDKVTYYEGEEKRYGKNGNQLKSKRKPVTTGDYWSEYYVKEVNKMYSDIQYIINQ